jgi:hypothetical protein
MIVANPFNSLNAIRAISRHRIQDDNTGMFYVLERLRNSVVNADANVSVILSTRTISIYRRLYGNLSLTLSCMNVMRALQPAMQIIARSWTPKSRNPPPRKRPR